MVDFCSVKTFNFPRLLVNMSLIFKGIFKIQIYHCFYMFIVYTVPLNYLFDEKMNLYKYIYCTLILSSSNQVSVIIGLWVLILGYTMKYEATSYGR